MSSYEQDPASLESSSPEVNKCEDDTTASNNNNDNDWQSTWFLDGLHATVRSLDKDGGLYFAAGTVTKRNDPVNYNAHHAVLWTHQVFEADNLTISFDTTRIDTSDYGAVLLYMQAQGIGSAPFDEDIYAWRALRQVPSMDLYYNYMNLLSLSFRENIRCKRYPWNDTQGQPYSIIAIEPTVDYETLLPGKPYRIVVEKRNPRLTLRLYDATTNTCLVDQTWHDTTCADRQPSQIVKGRIGIRHMATRAHVYRNFTVTQFDSSGVELHSVTLC